MVRKFDPRPELRADAILLKNRYGIDTLYVDNFSEIPEVLKRATQEPGRSLRATLNSCLSADFDARRRAHRELRELGAVGKRIAVNVLENWINQREKGGSLVDFSELVYSLGHIDPKEPELIGRVKGIFFKVLETSTHVEPAAHVLDRIAPLLTRDDLGYLEKLGKRFRSIPLKDDTETPDPDNRLPVYIERLILMVRAKYHEFPPRASV